jgi:hypothetical protein
MSSIDSERIAALQAERAQLGQAAAEVERDVATSVAINEAARRTSAENAAANERIRADMAESAARSSSATAHAAYEDARDERATAGNATVVATLAVLVALALIAVVGYFAWWQPAHTIDTPTNTIIEHTVKTSPPSQSSAPTINVSPPRVNVNIQNPPPPNTNSQSDGDDDTPQSGNGSSGDNGSNAPGSGG